MSHMFVIFDVYICVCNLCIIYIYIYIYMCHVRMHVYKDRHARPYMRACPNYIKYDTGQVKQMLWNYAKFCAIFP